MLTKTRLRITLLNIKRKFNHNGLIKFLRPVIILFALFMFTWLTFEVFRDREVHFKIIILDKQQHSYSPEANPGWVWNISGLEYFPKLEESPLKSRILAKTKLSTGFWVHQNSKDNRLNWMRLENFQYKSPKKIMLGIRYFIGGSGRIEIRLRESHSRNDEILALLQDEDEGKISQGFCSKIISAKLNTGFIDQIEFVAIILRPTSIIAIDEVIVTVADDESSRNLIYSLMPNQWCDSTISTKHVDPKPDEFVE